MAARQVWFREIYSVAEAGHFSVPCRCAGIKHSKHCDTFRYTPLCTDTPSWAAQPLEPARETVARPPTHTEPGSRVSSFLGERRSGKERRGESKEDRKICDFDESSGILRADSFSREKSIRVNRGNALRKHLARGCEIAEAYVASKCGRFYSWVRLSTELLMSPEDRFSLCCFRRVFSERQAWERGCHWLQP